MKRFEPRFHPPPSDAVVDPARAAAIQAVAQSLQQASGDLSSELKPKNSENMVLNCELTEKSAIKMSLDQLIVTD